MLRAGVFFAIVFPNPTRSDRMKRAWVLLLSLLFPVLAMAQAPGAPLREGVDYITLPTPQRWQPGPRIEVVEVFSYGCGHCDAFQPHVEQWKQRKPADVDFVYVGAAFNPDDPFGRLFFAADRAKLVPRLHQQVYDAVHREGTLPRNASVFEIGSWLTGKGFDGRRLLAAMQSKEVTALMERSHAFAVAHSLPGTPSLVVNGKYLVTGGRSWPDRLRILDALIARERAALAR